MDGVRPVVKGSEPKGSHNCRQKGEVAVVERRLRLEGYGHQMASIRSGLGERSTGRGKLLLLHVPFREETKDESMRLELSSVVASVGGLKDSISSGYYCSQIWIHFW